MAALLFWLGLALIIFGFIYGFFLLNDDWDLGPIFFIVVGAVTLVSSSLVPPANWTTETQTGVVSNIGAGLSKHSVKVMFEGSERRYKCDEELCLNHLEIGDQVNYHSGERGYLFMKGEPAMRDAIVMDQ